MELFFAVTLAAYQGEIDGAERQALVMLLKSRSSYERPQNVILILDREQESRLDRIQLRRCDSLLNQEYWRQPVLLFQPASRNYCYL